MFVFAQVSSIKTSRSGWSLGCRRCQLCRQRAIRRRSCSLGSRLFFESQLLCSTEIPDRPEADPYAAFHQFKTEGVEGQIRLLGQPLAQPVTLFSKSVAPTPAHGLGRGAACGSELLHPSDHD